VQFLTGTLQVLLTTGEAVMRGMHLTVISRPILSAIIVIVGTSSTLSSTELRRPPLPGCREIYLGRPASGSAAWKTATAHWFRYVLVTLRQYWSICWWLIISFAMFFAVLALVPNLGGGAIIAGGISPSSLDCRCWPAASTPSMPRSASRWAFRFRHRIPRANASVRRSMALLTERKGRIFLLGLLVIAMSLIIGVVLSPLTFLAFRRTARSATSSR